MPLNNFICPDGGQIKPADCLAEGGCRCSCRCATRNYLTLASRERKWTGKPSTTQLIQGTLCAFLKLTKPYNITPDSRAFMINGTMAHAKLETQDDELSKAEEVFSEDSISGIADIIEEENGIVTLWDYKTSGSYKVAKALGWHVIEIETTEIYKSGKNKGQFKKIKELRQDPEFIDVRDWALQLNFYRILAEKKLGKKISRLRVQVIVRDGGTYIARGRGIVRNVYPIDIPIMPDAEIVAYFDAKRAALLKALEQGYWNEICTKEENWDGVKCARYCEVADHCSYGKYLKEEKKTEEEMIKGLSETTRLSRLGHLRLGIKKVSEKSGKEHPAEVDYFVIDPATPVESERNAIIQEFHKLFGEGTDKPKSVQIMLPVDNEELLFPTYYKRYGSGTSLKCKGDGIEAVCGSKDFAKGLKEIGVSEMGTPRVVCSGRDCVHYKDKECSECAVLNVLIPQLPGAGVWQIVTGSIHSIININSSIRLIRAIAGRIHMIPLTLKRIPQETVHEGKKATHYPITIDTNIRLAEIQRFATLDPSKTLLPATEVDDKEFLLPDGSIVDKETGEIKEEVKAADAEVVDEGVGFGKELTEADKRKLIIKKMQQLFDGDNEKCKAALKANEYKSSGDIPADKLDDFLAMIQTELDNKAK
jgi:hypothetical protein